MTRRTARQRRFGAVAVVIVLMVLSACSSDGGDGVASAGGEGNPPNPVGTEDTGSLEGDAQALVFAGCMRDNGVDMPDPGPGQQGLGDAFQAVAGDYDQATMEQALSASNSSRILIEFLGAVHDRLMVMTDPGGHVHHRTSSAPMRRAGLRCRQSRSAAGADIADGRSLPRPVQHS